MSEDPILLTIDDPETEELIETLARNLQLPPEEALKTAVGAAMKRLRDEASTPDEAVANTAR